MLDNSGFLRGTYANVYNFNGQRATYIGGDPNNFNHSPYTQQFDEVNVYYHITKFRQYLINNFTFYAPNFTQIVAVIRWGFQDPIPAYFLETDGKIYFDNGQPSDTNSSREANIIYHEYMHAVQFDMGTSYTNPSATNEYKGVLEGLSDYFAYAHSGVGNILIYSSPSQQRSVYNHFNFQPTYPVHKFGELLSNILYELENIPRFNNEVFYAIRNFNSYTLAFLSFRDKLISSYNGYKTNQDTIQNKFAKHGIGDYANRPPSPPTNVTISGSYGGNPTINWAPLNDNDINHYKIYRKKYNENNFSLAGLTSTTSFTDYNITIQYNLVEDDIYYYVKTVDNENLLSIESDWVNVINTWYSFTKEKNNNSILAINADGANTIIPKEFSLSNYPNPFNPTTTISFSLPVEAYIKVSIFNILGEELEILSNGKMNAGYHQIKWNASKYPSGIYLLSLVANQAFLTKKILLLK